jgi:hypothetical protein
MPRKAQVQRSAEEKFAIVIEGLKSGNIAETCRNSTKLDGLISSVSATSWAVCPAATNCRACE